MKLLIPHNAPNASTSIIYGGHAGDGETFHRGARTPQRSGRQPNDWFPDPIWIPGGGPFAAGRALLGKILRSYGMSISGDDNPWVNGAAAPSAEAVQQNSGVDQ